MDYVVADKAHIAIELKKYQWDYIHDPQTILFAWAEEEEEGEMKKLKGTYTIWVGDSVVKDRKVLVYTKKENKIYVKYEPAANDTNKYVYIKIYYKIKGRKEEISSPATIENWWKIKTKEKTSIKFDSLPEGNYRICIRENIDNASKIDTIIFYLKKSICQEYEVKNISWLGQLSTEIKGRNCHWCSTWSKCCNGGTPCDTCPNDKKSKCCYEACKDSTLNTSCDSCNNKKICNKSKCKTNDCCYETCLAMIEKLGLKTERSLAIDIAKLANEGSWKHQSDLQVDRQKFDEGVSYIDETLKSGKPVIIGVHYEDRDKKVNNANSATFHYMVIMGKVCRNGEEFYRFYDPGRGEASYGANELNLLKVDRLRGMVYGDYFDNLYTITEIRKNK